MFTMENTAGYAAHDLADLNEALKILLADIEDEDGQVEKSYSDRLGNAWFEGITVEELVAAAKTN